MKMEAMHAAPGGGGATSPTGAGRPSTAGGFNKRKRSGQEFESSPGSAGGEGEEEDQERRRTPGVKRACNECRQQKVSHSFLLKLELELGWIGRWARAIRRWGMDV